MLQLLKGDAPQKTDGDLVRAFFAGDSAAFGELVRRHEKLVYALVRRYANDPEDARDLAQRAFLRAFEAVRHLRGGEAPFRAWVVRIAVNLGKNHARHERRWRRAPVELAAEQAAAGPTAAEALSREEQARRTRAAVLELPRRQREVLTLRVDGELHFAEIGALLGITENAAKVSFHLAVKRLRALVAREDV